MAAEWMAYGENLIMLSSDTYQIINEAYPLEKNFIIRP